MVECEWPRLSLAKVTAPDAPIVYGIVQPGEHVDDGVPFVQSRDVGGRISLADLQRTDSSIAAAYRRSTLAPCDVLFSLRGDIGQSSIAPAELQGANIARGVARIRVNGQFDPEFVRYVLMGPELRRTIAAVANGSTFREISIDELRRVQIPSPPLPEQRKIAAILRTWDEAIEKLDALIAQSTRRAAALARKLFDPCHPAFEGNRASDWAGFALGSLFAERNEIGSSDDRLLSITMGDGVISRDEVGRKDSSSEDKSSYKLILPGDIGYNTMRMWQGVSGLSSLRGIVSPAYTVVVPKVDRIDPRYAAHLFKSRRMVFDFQRYSQGLTSDTWNLKFPVFARINVLLPRLAMQSRQADVLDGVAAELRTLTWKAKALDRQKRGLMQKLLAGEWRTKF